MKDGIIGSGMVGATAAYAIMLRKAASDIVLIDANEKRAIAEAQDITHAVPFAAAKAWRNPTYVNGKEYFNNARHYFKNSFS